MSQNLNMSEVGGARRPLKERKSKAYIKFISLLEHLNDYSQVIMQVHHPKFFVHFFLECCGKYIFYFTKKIYKLNFIAKSSEEFSKISKNCLMKQKVFKHDFVHRNSCSKKIKNSNFIPIMFLWSKSQRRKVKKVKIRRIVDGNCDMMRKF